MKQRTLTRQVAILFFAVLGVALGDSLTLVNGTTMTGAWAGLSDGQISFVVDGTVRTFSKSEVAKISFGSQPPAIKLGQTAEQVKAALGDPKQVQTTGSSHEVYVYQNLRVTFTDGKVSGVE